ncbi:MAG: LPS export ABC transporter periplasmic protein LptC [Edaphocola sp.]
MLQYLIRKTGCKLALLLLCVASSLVFPSCENDLSKLPGANTLKDFEEDRAYDVTFIFSQNGKTKAQLTTKEFVGNETAKPPFMDFLKGVQLEVYKDSLKLESTVTCRSARYYTNSDNVIGRDSVVVRTPTGEKLETEELVWNQKLKRFYTDKFVKITGRNEIIWGEGLEANQDLTYVKILKQRGSLPVNEADFPVE